MIDVNVTVRFVGRASSTINAGDLLSINDVNAGTPCVEPSTQGVCFASNNADPNRQVMCLGFGYSEHSTATVIQRPLTLSYSDEVNDILPLLNVSDINTPINTFTYNFTGNVEAGQQLPFTDSPLILSAGTWAVIYIMNESHHEQSADIYIDGVFAPHTPEACGHNKFMTATSVLVESAGTTEISLVSQSSTTYQNACCTLFKLA